MTPSAVVARVYLHSTINMDEKEDAGKDASPWWKSIFQINKKLLPLKITLFMFSGAGYAVIPYLTIHMKASVT